MVLRATQLRCGYDKPIFLLDNFQLSNGEAVTIVGQNGSGKSTLLRTLCGLLPPLQGRVDIDGHSISSLEFNERAKCITMLMQMQSLDAATSVYDLVCLGRTPYLGRFGHLSKRDNDAVAEAISICDLKKLTHSPLGKISGGERQRARLAMVLAQQTQIVLLDEPTNHLDVAHRYALYEIVRRIRKERGAVVVMVCHSLEDARRFAEQTLLIHQGKTHMFRADEFDALKDQIKKNTGVPSEWVY